MQVIPNWIRGGPVAAAGSATLEKRNPHDWSLLYGVARSERADVAMAVTEAAVAFDDWSGRTPVERGRILSEWTRRMRTRAAELARLVATETGKPPRDAEGEVAGAIALGEFFAGEGMRLYGRSLTSGLAHKYTQTVRQPHGVAGLIVPANTPIANVAWKVFPALICGNTVVLKAAEDAPAVALKMAELAAEAGLPPGAFNVVQGLGDPAGRALVEDERVKVISFTGSTAVGRWIAKVAGERLARVSLELGGKNPFIVADDADLDSAVHWARLSAFSNAGQRCAAGSRLIIHEAVYDEFVERLLTETRKLRLGVEAGCDLGPLISRRQQEAVLGAIGRAVEQGGKVLCGGAAPAEPALRAGCYVEPTLIAGLRSDADLSCREIFGPVATLHRVADLQQAVQLANATPYGLTAAIHTRSVDRAVWFAQRVRAGVANVNIGTYGSEPHMPFGGFGDSGNGTREPGTEALDVYSELKTISFLVRTQHI